VSGEVADDLDGVGKPLQLNIRAGLPVKLEFDFGIVQRTITTDLHPFCVSIPFVLQVKIFSQGHCVGCIMNRSELPQEIADHIIDNLQFDQHALGTCSLVCKAWSFRARHHLFAGVLITESNSHTTTVLGPVACRCVRRVLLHPDLSTHSTVTLRSFLEPLIGVKFENAISLAFCAFNYAEFTCFDSEILHNLTPRIVKLYFSDFSFETTDHFTKFICTFRCLEKLKVNDIHCATIMAPSGSQLSLPVNLRVVEVSDDSLIRWLLSFQHLPPIHTIDGGGFAGEHAISTSDLLRTLGASLETVRLTCLGMLSSSPNYTSINIMYKGGANYQFIDLRHNIRLRSLHFKIKWAGDGTAEGIAYVLSRIASMRVDTVSFTILRHLHDRFGAIDWGMIDEVLAQPTFAKLQRVEITIIPPCNMVSINSIVDRLPECNSRGILVVEGKVNARGPPIRILP
jgi:hypothetical protein